MGHHLFLKYVLYITLFLSSFNFCVFQNKLQNDVSAQMSEIHRLKGKKCTQEGAISQHHVFVNEIGLLWDIQVQHYFCTVGLFLPPTPWCKPIMVFCWLIFFLDCGVFDCWFGACSHVCVYIYRTGKRVETGDHPTGRPAEGSAEKQHQSGEEAGIWEVNPSTGGLSLTQKKESCFLCTYIPTFGKNC